MNNTNTSNRPSKCTLMRRIMELGFYIDDIGLYLDTHPDDCRSLARYHEIHHEYDTAVQNYAEWYGPLNKHVTAVLTGLTGLGHGKEEWNNVGL